MSRSGRRRGGTRGTGGAGDRTTGVVLGLLGAILLVGLGGAWWWVTSSRVTLDAANCPTTGPKGIQVVLIDRSDPITPLQQQQVLQHVLRLVAAAKAGERFDLYVAEGDGVNTVSPNVSVCSPGRGEDANELYQNRARIQRAFEERFVSVLRQAVGTLMEPATRPTSPLLESIRTAAVASFGGTDRSLIPLRMLVVSDMVQHSPSNSHFRGETSFADLAKRPEWRALQPSLTGVEVSVLYLLRPSARRPNGQPIQNRGHQTFWEQAVRAGGGLLVSLEAI